MDNAAQRAHTKMNESKRRLHLPSLNPQRAAHNNADDNATQTSSSSTVKSSYTNRSERLKLTSPADENTVTSINTASSRSDRVLRYGETVDSLFCLDGSAAIDSKHRQLCQEICGEKCHDAESWADVLMGTLSQQHPADEITGKRLLILYRRATSRFKLPTEPSLHDEVLKIWLLYALVLFEHDSPTKAKDTYKHIQRMMYPNEAADFWECLFETDLDTGIDGLKAKLKIDTMASVFDKQLGGLRSKGLLHVRFCKSKIALPSLNRGSALRDSATKDEDTPAVQFNIQKSVLLSRQSTQSGPEAEQKRVVAITSAPKRDSDNLAQPTTAEDKASSYRTKMEARKKARTERLAARTKPKKKEVSISAILSQTMDGGGSDDDEANSRNSVHGCNDHLNTTAPETHDNWLVNSEGNELKSSAPDSDQARKHFNENISPIDEEGTASVKDMDLGYLLNWDPNKRDIKKVTIAEDALRKEETREEKKAPKITRNDLGYMMNWEPFPKRDGESNGDGSTAKPKCRSLSNMSRIEEEPTEASATTGDNGATTSSGSTCSQESQPTSNQQKRTSIDTHASSKSQGTNKEEKSTEASQDVEQSFLPLIESSNIIKVDNVPYAKLAVIGKGGSCKVYRALSRECDVVALKKVKLDGLSKQAIDGYANEIALLNRLKGNPAIIQLYSSEVDLERKSIYLVMELGEVDLNYVLRQQELLSSKQGRGGRSSLNMNFIRLTWQQMLSAVHSIHEERIVHSDLKPAVSIAVSFHRADCSSPHELAFE